MSRKEINRKLNTETAHIRSILSDFRKTKYKCANISQQIGEELPDKVHFQSVEKETILKMELLDLTGLVQLKNTLMKTLTELYDLESELEMKKAKYLTRKQFNGLTGAHNSTSKQSKVNKTNHSLHQIDRRAAKVQPEQPEKESPAKQKEKLSLKQKTSLQVSINPQPSGEQENKKNQSKLRGSEKKYCLQQSTESSQHAQSETKEFLLEQPEFITIKEELERYQMRQQQLESQINRRISEGIKRYLNSLEIVEETNEYKIMKVLKQNDWQETQIMSSETSIRLDGKKINQNMKGQCVSCGNISYEKDNQIAQIEMDLKKEECNVEEVVSKISETMDKSQIRLKELRDQRKKMFLDQDIWAEFEEI